MRQQVLTGPDHDVNNNKPLQSYPGDKGVEAYSILIIRFGGLTRSEEISLTGSRKLGGDDLPWQGYLTVVISVKNPL